MSCYLEVAVKQWTPLVSDLPNSTSAQEDLACSDTSGSSITGNLTLHSHLNTQYTIPNTLYPIVGKTTPHTIDNDTAHFYLIVLCYC